MQVETDIQPTQTKKELMLTALHNPLSIQRELNNRHLYHFIKYFWSEVSNDAFIDNWHVSYICEELEIVIYRVANNQKRLYDLLINIPPGMTKTILVMIMLPVWCWTKWYWMRFITGSYAADLSLESAEYSRDLIRSDKFKQMYPELGIKEDKDNKSNYKVIKKIWGRPNKVPQQLNGGNRFSTGVGGKLTGFHGHVLLVDDPIDPNKAVSEVELRKSNRWISQTLSTRKTDKTIVPTIMIMQRLHQDDPSGHLLINPRLMKKIKHICLPGEIRNYHKKLNPPELAQYYIDELLDPKRLNWETLDDMEAMLGQYGYAGQVGQDPTPPGGGMFKVDHFQYINSMPMDVTLMASVRYWDKAGSQGAGCYTVGVKMHRTVNGKLIVSDVKRGQWATEERERIIRETAEVDGQNVQIYYEQEPGSGGKESAEATTRNLLGYSANPDKPSGDKIFRADPFSVQVNNGNVLLLRGEWNHDYVEEFRFFPFSTYKDQVDASSGGFSKLVAKREARVIGSSR
jgi:predicted phage terminase large subunit-like protein